MATVTERIHEYLRHNKKFPHVLCPGCGHGIVLGSMIRSVHALGLSKDDVVLVAGIGCSGRVAVYVDFNTVHTCHGRALTVATGIKLANPRLKVLTVMGDGDALAIGGNHFIHAVRRNIGVTALVLNNSIYGMTGGQVSPTSPCGTTTTTTPLGQLERPFDVVELGLACGAGYVARATSMHALLLDRLLQEALSRPGFCLVEVISPCPTQYGRKNGFKTAVEMYRWCKERAVQRDRWDTLSKERQAESFPIGVFRDATQAGFEERYYAACAAAQEKRPCPPGK